MNTFSGTYPDETAGYYDLKEHTLLIVDDHPRNLAVIVDYLEDHGFPVLVAQNGESGIRRAGYARPALILLDVLMPGMDGFETCRRLKADEATKDIPVIFMTALSDTVSKVKGFEAGGVDYITKPFQVKEVLARVKTHLSLRNMQKRLEEKIFEQKQTQEKLRKAKEEWEQTFDTVPDLIAILDKNHRIMRVNKAMSDCLGILPEMCIGRTCYAGVHGTDHPPSFCPHLQLLKDGREHTSEVYEENLGGHFIVTASPLFDEDGEVTGCVHVARNINERKEAEEKLRRLFDEARQARKDAENASRAKSDFLAHMSHEIRTPLNAIIGMSGLLLDTDLDAEQREQAQAVYISSEMLLSIISDILDFSKIEAGKIELENTDFNLDHIIGNVRDMLMTQARDKGIEVVFRIGPDVPLLLRGDPTRLRQIMINLVNNAIKFTEQGGITVCVTMEKENGARALLRFSVTDTGIGIPKECADRVFKSFSQADASTTRRYGGTGLGLAISKRLAEMMGGEIGVESEDRKGSTFWFTACFEKLPDGRKIIADPGAGLFPAEEDSPLSGEQRQSLRILLAEDSEMNQKVALAVLKKLGFSANVACNGGKAVEMLGTEHYDLVLMDVRMPETDGLEAARIIRNPESGVFSHGIPIIAMTADATSEDRKKCIRSGISLVASSAFRRRQVSNPSMPG
ncbi:response regulator, partial [Desulfobacterales bacterium HSG2]|nr:response regulator [Desulfobacterales bacterium HSG2]